MSVKIRTRFAVVALVIGLLCLAQAAYIPAKAWLAQRLIAMAWQQRVEGGDTGRPWPWADTAPVARLYQPRLAIDQYVLQGASGRNLAFGPAHVGASSAPSQSGNIVISGHRDTHFAWLRHLRPGDELVLERDDRRWRRYRVIETSVHHEREFGLVDPLAGDQLRLLTCYPFLQVDPGTPWRFLVTAVPDGVGWQPGELSPPVRTRSDDASVVL
ncbi:MAG: class GN sortase [Gammaproteobacteria bacterium]|nr:class GN sortase [Gammaproteobacteria bacterium]